MEENFKVKDFGPINSADIRFGDLTILIGPQASGKSLFLELFKLVKDHDHIVSTLKSYNYILDESAPLALADYYFGEGVGSLVTSSTNVELNNAAVTERLTDTKSESTEKTTESVFYVPAQRILSIADGRPKNFMEFDLSTPYPLRSFSEKLRVFLQTGLGNPEVLFPMKTGLANSVKESINSSIFHDGKVILDHSNGQRKMKLSVGHTKLPFMTWSAGQKEFMPLLLAVYYLTKSDSSMRKPEDYKWVIIEEPEMGLHPKAIESVIIAVIELLKQGFKVILSTHSSIFVDFAWTLRLLADCNEEDFRDAMYRLFDLHDDKNNKSLFNDLQAKSIKVFYFDITDRDSVMTTDISTLDVWDDNKMVAEWGGLSSFASRASEIVSEYGQS